MSAPVTEAHRKLVAAIIRDLSIDDGAQLIADSEAKAVEQTNAQVESLLWAAKNAIPASEHPAEPTVENWAWQIRNLGEDRRLVYADRDKLRAEVAWWKNWHEENEKLEDGIAVKVQATIDQLRAEVERLKAASDKEDSMATTTIDQRDRAEDAADKLASAILGEPIDWPDHDAKWSEALEEAECVHDLKASLSEMIAQSRVDSSVAGIAICNEMGAIARAERAEAELKEWSLLNLWGGTPEIIHDFVKGQQARIHAAQDVEAELAGIRALADRRNERDHSQDTTHQLVAALDQALDIAQAELATERARLDWLEKARPNAWALGSEECGEYWILTDTGEKHPEEAEEFATLRAAIDAAMKEGAK